MPGRIIVLPTELTDKIAAGEVIERPASIVKELLENSLDAGATDITIEIEKGGRGAIRIIDNGEGMEREDIRLAFARFATSKIYQFDDIYNVRSFGFRGEALPSIASISRVEMVSRRKADHAGTRIIVEAGEIRDLIDAGCPPGTSVYVSHIFDSVPVRKKFLKADTTEQGACLDWVTRLAFSHPGVRLRVIANGRETLSVPAGGAASERLALLLGDMVDHARPITATKGGINLMGFVSPPEFTRSSSRNIYCYVNRRFVKDYLMHHAVMTAYRRLITPRRYPAAVIFISLPPEDVDVNVHPAKMEVRFRSPKDVYEIIVTSLTGYLSRPSSGGAPAGTAFNAPVGAQGHREYQKRIGDALKRYTLSAGEEKLLFSDVAAESRTRESVQAESLKPGFVQTEHASSVYDAGEAVRFSDLEYIGQISRTYLVFSSPSGLVLVDQHAAHERVLFEKLRDVSMKREKAVSQPLLVPEVVSLPPGELAVFLEALPALRDAGLEVEPFGGDAIVIKSVPAILSHLEPKSLLLDVLHEFGDMELTKKSEGLFAVLACRGAVKAGQKLTEAEVITLCRSLDAIPFSATCPHGRPVRISIGLADMERMFKRR